MGYMMTKEGIGCLFKISEQYFSTDKAEDAEISLKHISPLPSYFNMSL